MIVWFWFYLTFVWGLDLTFPYLALFNLSLLWTIKGKWKSALPKIEESTEAEGNIIILQRKKKNIYLKAT